MEIILLEDVENVGQAGEIRDVAAGYARNYLIPRGLATMVTEGNLKQLELQRKAEARRQQKLEGKAKEVAKELEGLTVTFLVKAGEKDRLYGSITSGDIAGSLEKETGKSFDRRKIELEDPIRELGTYIVPIKLLPDVTPSITVVVEKEEESEHEKKGEDDEKNRQKLT